MSLLNQAASYDILQLIDGFIQQFSETMEEFFFVLVLIAILVSNITLIAGGITYLIDYNEKNGKLMIARSIIILAIIISIFKPFKRNETSTSADTTFAEEFLPVFSYIITYLLFAFASLALILFIANLGLYVIDHTSNRAHNVKKSFICLFCVFLPIGLQFPKMPVWIW
ncbi:MAG: hypothetical protein ACTSPG_01330 [Candidatus Hodarchaeales archaeon]